MLPLNFSTAAIKTKAGEMSGPCMHALNVKMGMEEEEEDGGPRESTAQVMKCTWSNPSSTAPRPQRDRRGQRNIREADIVLKS
ncbi:hypothetical protein NL676_033741 [Syzygium grande]|nr:hypothetical protein NL676_033741 [Syzygium grande]